MPAHTFNPAPVTLEGAHVRVEPLAPRHAPHLADAGADPAIWTWLSVTPPADPEERLAFFQQWIDDALALEGPGRFEGGVAFAIIRKSDGRAVGSTRYLAIRPTHRALEIGWTWLAPDAQRTPINTETKLLLLTHAFDALGARRVELKTDDRNEKSKRAILRLGATPEGVFRAHMIRPDGTRRDSAFFSVIDEQWPRVRERLRAALDAP